MSGKQINLIAVLILGAFCVSSCLCSLDEQANRGSFAANDYVNVPLTPVRPEGAAMPPTDPFGADYSGATGNSGQQLGRRINDHVRGLAKIAAQHTRSAYNDARPAIKGIEENIRVRATNVRNHPRVTKTIDRIRPHVETAKARAVPVIDKARARAAPMISAGQERVGRLWARSGQAGRQAPGVAPVANAEQYLNPGEPIQPAIPLYGQDYPIPRSTN